MNDTDEKCERRAKAEDRYNRMIDKAWESLRDTERREREVFEQIMIRASEEFHRIEREAREEYERAIREIEEGKK